MVQEKVEEFAIKSIITRLRSLSKGKRVFRVQHKIDKSYCIQFEEWDQIEAGEWWKSHRDNEQYANFELASVEISSEQDRTMREAADMLEFFLQKSERVKHLETLRELAQSRVTQDYWRGQRDAYTNAISVVARNP